MTYSVCDILILRANHILGTKLVSFLSERQMKKIFDEGLTVENTQVLYFHTDGQLVSYFIVEVIEYCSD